MIKVVSNGNKVLAVGGVLAALFLATFMSHDQRRLHMPDPWAYEIAIQQFAQGQWVLDDEQAAQVRTDVRLRGGSLEQYVPIGENQWAFRQSAGYPLMVVPFYKTGVPRAANLLLAVIATLILFQLLARRYDTGMALIGTVLLVWSPMFLLGLHYFNMATFASGMLLLISGGLLLWVSGWEKPPSRVKSPRRKRSKKRTVAKSEASTHADTIEQNVVNHQAITFLLLFLAGLAAGWAVVVRNVNVLPAVVLGVFFLFVLWRQYQKRNQLPWLHLLAFTIGGCIALAGLFAYNTVTFGSPIDTGYAYPSPDDSHYLWKGDPMTQTPSGVPTWVAEGTVGAIVRTLFDHLRLWARPATLGWPFMPLVIVSIIWLLWRRQIDHVFLFLLLWILAVYAFYAGIVFFGVTRALSVPFNQLWGFFTPARYLFPATLPFVLLTVELLSRWPRRLALGFAAVYLVLGGVIFWQVIQWT